MNNLTMFHSYGSPSEDFLTRQDEAAEVMPAGLKPNPSDWGICMGGGASAEIGGQLMMFHWLPDRESLVAALSKYLVYSYNPHDNFDITAAQARVDIALAAFEKHNDTQMLTEDLRTSVHVHVRVDWVGPVKELAVLDSEFAKDIRSDYFDATDNECHALTDNELEQLCDFLDGWMSGS